MDPVCQVRGEGFMAARRSTEVELCFESMTDLITNLAGGLVLLVLLLMGLTRETTSIPTVNGNGTSMHPLLQRINLLHSSGQDMEKKIQALEERNKEMQREIKGLLGKTGPGPQGLVQPASGEKKK
jgi:hypothetical protein